MFPRPVPFAFGLTAALLGLASAQAQDIRILDQPRGIAPDRRTAVVVERVLAGSNRAETYVVVVQSIDGAAVPMATLFIGLGAVVDDIRLGPGSVDVAYRDHWPVDTPGQPTRQKIRAFAVTPDWAEPAWATPNWARSADLPATE